MILAACGAGPATPPLVGPGGDAGSAVPSPTPAAPPTPRPTRAAPTPLPTPRLAVAPLTGLLVEPALAARHPIAVIIDDHRGARPQSGFSEASVVWQAPAEGGIPRYMMVFAEGDPASVGPVRSARSYFVEWAAEWRAVFVHAGGSPQAISLLRTGGQGQLVYDADEFRWGGIYLWRATDRFAPHNVYTDGESLRALAERVGATGLEAKPAWRFADDIPLDLRPQGSRIDFAYPYAAISYRYERWSNTWRRYVDGEAQVDRASERVVAPKNVVIMEVVFQSLGPAQHSRLDAAVVGTGRAWIATNGRTIRGSWKKDSVTAPTRFFDADGEAVTLTRGQTFVQVVPRGTKVSHRNGQRVFDPERAAERGIR